MSDSSDDSILILKSEDGKSFEMKEKELRKRFNTDSNDQEENKNDDVETSKHVKFQESSNLPIMKLDQNHKTNNKYSSESSVPTVQKDLRNANGESDFEMESINIYSDVNLMIKNIDTGETFDLYRETDRIENINNEISFWKVEKDEAWKDFWKEINKDLECIWDASEIGNLAVLKRIVDKRKVKGNLNINSKTLDDWTALHLATNEGHIDIVEFLIQNNASIEAETCSGRRPLHVAVLRGNELVVEILLKYGANPNSQDQMENTPVHLASVYGHESVLIKLLHYDPDLTIRNNKGLTAIQVSSSPKIISIFEKHSGKSNIFEHCGIGITSQNTLERAQSKKFSAEDLSPKKSESENSESNQKVQPLKTIGKIKRVTFNTKASGNDDNFFKRLFATPFKKEERIKPLQSQPQPEMNKVCIHESGSGVNKLGPDSFTYLKKLGQGSFGEVFLAEMKSTGKHYAIKVLRKDRIIGQNLFRYAKTERNVLSLQNHPFIVKLNFAFQSRTKLFLVLDYCPFGDLGKFLNIQRKFPEGVTKIYIAEIILALEILHEQHIIFRDLKPENVVIDASGHACLTDFGLSKQGISDNLSRSFCGTMAYLAPEMIKRVGHGKTVDWYLVGVLMYELLAGTPPYYNPNKSKLFENILGGSLSYPKGISQDCKSILKGLLCRDPKLRLGAVGDAAEIKAHKWFNDIDWNELLLKKIEMPLPPKKPFPTGPPLEIDFDRDIDIPDDMIIEKNKKKFENWTFIGETELEPDSDIFKFSY